MSFGLSQGTDPSCQNAAFDFEGVPPPYHWPRSRNATAFQVTL